MGGVQVKYRAARGSHAEGEEVSDPADFFEIMFGDGWGEFKEQYDALPEDKQAELNAIFGGEDVLSQQVMA
eukprot:CAMPEP_0185568812 /NCGR_PEP_ID=MMETSP0434-20130131/1656_1 /TAXON_ID=626734 ORGANISM="Favella taraikaensis, Strain Fe Narragansett Bay" /NCGR_SAMPLE_ID=MMETSP0434 /ASSEMBLY_ACC=CAM_ASM_000379 /LENGTH=70 /DNA_ID=CAMNT_0028183433 /DNA_START=29 /DNA_END=241 /DNA_ORIENTATION=+